MAVPKKRTSKSKKNKRKTNWKNKAVKQVLKAINLANMK
uniref:50S ribosomal protein L32 n=2 Tax=Ulva TaxID=3118 RepID=A0A0U2UPK6_9CHLO|nr:50S ribosomal protein L32 [Ulva fasciata]YP_009633166.1 50S ribosomal protein L32 [Ulva lactuca]ALR86944.1 50S ribosomal protein L32 [Ulva fasciata]QBS48024.1 50S ribosomal protein L32 [Ulva lactuca]